MIGGKYVYFKDKSRIKELIFTVKIIVGSHYFYSEKLKE